ncbi:transposase [Curtanaerobium respiraculi]|uniref:transposase n=1 Tax=Curtanaerobium respiraculi TaxID=2949669 RepID=UPI0024B36D9E|nr:transposase [Curtanaerobium respiraculi]
MAYQRREQSEADIYHVTQRGSGRHLIFEDDADRDRFLEVLSQELDDRSADLYAFALMGNHVHLLLRSDMAALARIMQNCGRRYAVYYNRRHDHIGHLMQGRYGSVPIKGDAQLMETVRYIHRNPIEAGLSKTCLFEWSSYREYVGSPRLCTTAPVLDLFGGVRQFADFHKAQCDESSLAHRSKPILRLSDAAALETLEDVLCEAGLGEVPVESKVRRDEVLAELRLRGLSIRQIERLTGIGRGIVSRACKS